MTAEGRIANLEEKLAQSGHALKALKSVWARIEAELYADKGPFAPHDACWAMNANIADLELLTFVTRTQKRKQKAERLGWVIDASGEIKLLPLGQQQGRVFTA